jgi:hypothetical protein
MPIGIKTDLEWGQVFYMKSDPEQVEHRLTGVIIRPGKAVKFILSHQGDECEVYDFEASTEIDQLKKLDGGADDPED